MGISGRVKERGGTQAGGRRESLREGIRARVERGDSFCVKKEVKTHAIGPPPLLSDDAKAYSNPLVSAVCVPAMNVFLSIKTWEARGILATKRFPLGMCRACGD